MSSSLPTLLNPLVRRVLGHRFDVLREVRHTTTDARIYVL
jgi:hypothetical protein